MSSLYRAYVAAVPHVSPQLVAPPPSEPSISLPLLVMIAGLLGGVGGAIAGLLGVAMQYARKDEKVAFEIKGLKQELMHQRELDNHTHTAELNALKTEIKAYFQRRDDNTVALRNDLVEVRNNLQGLGAVIVRDTDVKWTWRRHHEEPADYDN